MIQSDLFNPLVGGHLTFARVTYPPQKRSRRIARSLVARRLTLQRCNWCCQVPKLPEPKMDSRCAYSLRRFGCDWNHVPFIISINHVESSLDSLIHFHTLESWSLYGSLPPSFLGSSKFEFKKRPKFATRNISLRYGFISYASPKFQK